MSVSIVETGKFDLRRPLLIEGFPGAGLVGTIAANFIVDKLQMEPLGHITSTHFTPLVAIHNSRPLHPARIYKSRKHNLIVLFSELVVPLPAIHELAKELLAWKEKHKVRQIISLGGINIKGELGTVYGVASTPELGKFMESKGVKLVREGATTGVSGLLLAECATTGFPAMSLLAEAQAEFLDPNAAAMVIEKMSALTGIKLDTRELQKQAKLIEGKMKDMFEQARGAHESYKKYSPTETMYG